MAARTHLIVAASLAGTLLGCSQRLPSRPPPPHATRPDIVTGIVSLPDKTELPTGTVVVVTLAQVSDSQVSGAVVAEQEFPVFDPREPPLFTLRFDPSKIDATREYVVRAKVLVDAKLRYENQEGVAVLTRGRPPHAVVPVQPAR